MDFNIQISTSEALTALLNTTPWITLILASIGIATIAYILYCASKPFFVYITGSSICLANFLASFLIISGCALIGYAKRDLEGAFELGGFSATFLGALYVLWGWLRHLLKWSHNELDGL